MFRQLNLLGLGANPEDFSFPVEIKRKPYQRTMRLSIQTNGKVVVTAAKSTPSHELNRFIESHRAWIEKGLASFSALRLRYPQKQYVEGETFLFQGQNLILNVRPEAHSKRIRFSIEEKKLICQVPFSQWESEPPVRLRNLIRKSLREFYALQGENVLTERVRFFSQAMSLYPTGLSFRSQKTRWGSCTSQGRISLNWRLIAMPSEVLDYVVVHELAHLRHHNHSPRFWNLVEQHMPRYKGLRLWLKRNQYEADFLAVKSELHLEGI